MGGWTGRVQASQVLRVEACFHLRPKLPGVIERPVRQARFILVSNLVNGPSSTKNQHSMMASSELAPLSPRLPPPACTGQSCAALADL
ncbi:hypothetical protein RRG08_053473 [Elysia crispata]|uniref:Uncharacterized protein n=1 Tax=Elysia crispata TaxID=231223 RepID=A0AAE1A0Z7_9GAST|nr:hypothetical protein RRG08_053473 [Elysia crispata]